MKRILVVIIVLLLIPFDVLALNINSKNVYFYNLDREEVIYEVDSHEKIAIASMTKIMTSIVALENIENLDAKVTLTSKDFKGLREANASTAGFKKGEIVTYRDLLYGLMLPSGADAALALANNIAGSEKEFVKLMNDKVKEIGLENTKFANTTGLDEEAQYSSVYDVYKFLSYALKNEEFKKIFTTKKYTTSNKRLKFKSTLLTTSNKYNIDTKYILGSKTGYTYDAGLCLASIAEHNGDLYLLVTARADYKSKKPYHIYDANTIYKYYFNNYSYQLLGKKGDIIVTIKDEYNNEIVYKFEDDVEKYLINGAVITTKYVGEEILTTDMKVGELVGTYEIYADDVLVYSHNLYLENKIVNYAKLILIVFFTVVCLTIIKIILKRIIKKGKK